MRLDGLEHVGHVCGDVLSNGGGQEAQAQERRRLGHVLPLQPPLDVQHRLRHVPGDGEGGGETVITGGEDGVTEEMGGKMFAMIRPVVTALVRITYFEVTPISCSMGFQWIP